MIVKVCGMREPENIRAIERSRLDGIHFLSPFRPLRDALSGIPAGTMPPSRGLCQREHREYLAESTGIRPALYPTAWQRDTGTMPQIKNRRIRNR